MQEKVPTPMFHLASADSSGKLVKNSYTYVDGALWQNAWSLIFNEHIIDTWYCSYSNSDLNRLNRQQRSAEWRDESLVFATFEDVQP